jgi:hypothetical protein
VGWAWPLGTVGGGSKDRGSLPCSLNTRHERRAAHEAHRRFDGCSLLPRPRWRLVRRAVGARRLHGRVIPLECRGP